MKLRALYLLVMLATFTSGLWAQDLSKLYVVGSAKHEPGELIDRSVKDVNQMVCAGLIIYSDLEGLTYQANNEIVKMNRMPGKDFLFIQSEERVITVYKTGYAPLKLVLNEYGIKLAEGKVYSITVTGNRKEDLVPVTILTEPGDAMRIVDGENKGVIKNIKLNKGVHRLRLEQLGYASIDTVVSVSVENAFFDFKMVKSQPVSVYIESKPIAAEIFLNDESKGISPFSGFLQPGTYRLRISAPGYLEEGSEFTVAIGSNKIEKKIQLTKATASLDIIPSVKDAYITVNDLPFSKGPREFTPGKYVIRATRAGYLPVVDTLVLKSGDEIKKEITLKQNIGSITVNVFPSDAVIRLNDSTIVNGAPLLITPGAYFLKVMRKGYKTEEKTLTVQLDDQKTETITLRALQEGTLQIAVAPEDARVEVREQNTTIFSEKGSFIQQIGAGEYTLIVFKEGYKPDVQEITILENEVNEVSVKLTEGQSQDTQGGNIKIVDHTATATFLSVLVPGLGEMVYGSTLRGIPYLLATGGGVAAYFVSQKNYDTKIEEYNKGLAEYKAFPTIAKFDEIKNTYDTADKHRNIATIALSAAIGVYVFNIVDALLFTPEQVIMSKDEEQSYRLLPSITPEFTGFSLKVTF